MQPLPVGGAAGVARRAGEAGADSLGQPRVPLLADVTAVIGEKRASIEFQAVLAPLPLPAR